MRQEYSNVSGDFDAAPVAGTKRIVFSNFANNVISGDLSALNFIDARIYSRLPGGTIIQLPTTSLSYSDEDGLTLHDMAASFSEGEAVAVFMRGRDKGFDEAADAYKTIGSGGVAQVNFGGVAQPIYDATPQGSFYRSSALEGSGVVRNSAGVLLSCKGRLSRQASDGNYFLQVYDSATVPANGPVTLLFSVALEHISGFSTEINVEYPRGKAAANGISFCLSSTEFEKTAVVGQNYLALEFEHKA